MLKKILKAVICSLLLTFIITGCVGCVTPSGKMYRSKKSDLTDSEILSLIRTAEDKNNSLENILYTYDFHVDYKLKGTKYSFGTQNEIAFTDLGTDSAKGHRINTYTYLNNENQQETKSESFFFDNGKIYTKRFGKYYWSEMKQESFIPYTEYSSLSANTDFLSEVFFEKATVYTLFGGDTVICFTKQTKEQKEYLSEGIISFVGLDQTEYEYSVDDILLTVKIAKDGFLTEKVLTFTVEYYDKDEPKNVIEYDGEFSYKLNQTDSITVQEKDKSNLYSKIENIELLSSITNAGYIKLLNLPFDIAYSKEITVSMGSEQMYYKAALDVKSLKTEDSLTFSRINTEKMTINTQEREENKHLTAGAFINGDEYKYLSYDYISKDKTENNTTTEELSDFVTGAVEDVAAERLIDESEIISVAVEYENDETVTYRVDVTADVKRSYAAYFYAYFQADDSTTLDFSKISFSLERFNLLITIRKSDGCLMKQELEYTAKITPISGGGTITIKADCITDVKSTDENLTFLTPEDFNAEVEANKAQ